MSNRSTTVLWFLLGVSITLAIVLGVIVLSGGDDGDAASTSVPTTVAESTPTTTATVTTTTAAATTTVSTTAATPCTGLPSATTPAVPGPGVSSVDGDFDGDGAMDRLIGYESGGVYKVQIALSYGYATEIDAMDAAEALAAQAFAEGSAWLGLARVGSGASTDIVQWYMLDGCSIVKVTTDGAGEASFLRGGSVTHGDGLVCNPSSITVNSVLTGDGITWEYYSTTYEWDPVARTFVGLGVSSSTLVSPADDDAIFSAYDLVCPFSP